MVKEFSLYIHVPFCLRKCPYCQFYSIAHRQEFSIRFVNGIIQEKGHYLDIISNLQFSSFYFGGGTPLLLGAQNIRKLINEFPIQDAAEITCEANPETISKAVLTDLLETGVNRLSIGVQSLQPSELLQLGRNHSQERAISAVMEAEKAGFSNISIDLMYEIPGQTLLSWEKTLLQAVKLPITHISLYSLTIEPGTPFAKNEAELKQKICSPEEGAKMYQMAQQILQESGFCQYEISAFAKNGLQSRHNVGYWTARPFLGLGPSAYSYINGKRWRNVANLFSYLQALDEGRSPIDFSEELPLNLQKRERICINLRLLEGVDLASYMPLEDEVEKSITHLLELELLSKNGGKLSLTAKGILYYDEVASTIV